SISYDGAGVAAAASLGARLAPPTLGAVEGPAAVAAGADALGLVLVQAARAAAAPVSALARRNPRRLILAPPARCSACSRSCSAIGVLLLLRFAPPTIRSELSPRE